MLTWLPAGYLVFGLGWVLGSDYVLTYLFSGTESQLLLGGTLKGILFVVLTTVLLAYAMAVIRTSTPETWQPEVPQPAQPWKPLAAIVVAILLVTTAGVVVFERRAEFVRQDAVDDMTTNAMLKARQVEAWYRSQLGVARDITVSPFTAPMVQQWLTDRSPELTARIQQRLEALRLSQDFIGVQLYDPAGNPLLGAGAAVAVDESLRDDIASAAATTQIQATSLRRLPGTRTVGLQVIAPVTVGAGHEGLVGVIVATADATDLLAGLGQNLPRSDASETVLVRRNGDRIEYITTHRSDDGLPLTPVIGSGRKDIAGAQILRGGAAPVEALSYRGVPVLAVGAAAAGTPWHVVAMRTTGSIHKQVLVHLVETATLSLLAISVALALVFLWWNAERRSAIAALSRSVEHGREMEARLGWISNSANDVILLIDETGRLCDVNERAVSTYGYERGELLTKSIADLRGPDPGSAAKFDRQFATTLEHGSLLFETSHVRKDGSTLPVEVSSRRVDHGGRTYVQSIVRDITERRQHESLLRASEARYRKLFEAVPHPMCVMEPGTLRILMVNAAAMATLGYDRDEFLGMTLWDLQPADRLQALQDRLAQDAGGVRQSLGVWPCRRKDGGVVELDTVSHLVNFDGADVRILLATDVSRELRAERERVANEQRYRELFEANPHPMWVYDSETLRFLMVNDAAITQYGYSEAEFLGMTIADIRPAAEQDAVRRHAEQHRDLPLQESGVWTHRRKDGHLIEVEISSHILRIGERTARVVLAHNVTARVAAERSLRASENRYRNLFEQANDGIVWLTADCHCLDANNAALDLFGCSRDELQSVPLLELLDESERPRVQAAIAGSRSGSRQLEPLQVLSRTRKDGSRFMAEIRSRVLDDGSILATLRDLTATLAAQRQIERQRDMFDLLSQSNQLMMRRSDEEALFRDVVQLAVERGRFKFAWIGRIDANGGVSPVASCGDDHDLLEQALRATGAGAPAPAGALAPILLADATLYINDMAADPRKFISADLARRCGIGSVCALPVRTMGVVTHGLMLGAAEPGTFDEEIVRTLEEMAADVAFAIDVFAIRRALDENRKLLQSIIDASDTLIYACDAEGRFIYLNEACARLLGVDAAAAVGRSRAEVMDGAQAAAHRANDLQVLRSGVSMHFEEAGPDGVQVFLSTRYPLRDLEGRIYGVGGMSADITELRRMQVGLASANAGLERKVEERTRELVAAKDRAEVADRAKSAFLGSISHELRSPLHSIIGFTSVLVEGIDGQVSDAQREHLTIVGDSAQHLLGIVNDLIDISRLQAGSMSIDSRAFRPHGALRRAVDRHLAAAQAKGLSISLEDGTGEVSVLGDERRFEQVIRNLVSNAVKFTDSGGVVLRAQSTGSRLRVDVADTGRGIAHADVQRLFRRFTQLDPGAGQLTAGTGLGLAIAHDLAVAMGGSLTATSEPGKGSTFSFTLPLDVRET